MTQQDQTIITDEANKNGWEKVANNSKYTMVFKKLRNGRPIKLVISYSDKDAGFSVGFHNKFCSVDDIKALLSKG